MNGGYQADPIALSKKHKGAPCERQGRQDIGNPHGPGDARRGLGIIPANGFS